MSNRKPLIGYASMNIDVHPQSYRTCRKDNITKEKLEDLIRHNLMVLERTIDYNISHNNKFFRVSSSLIPFGSSPLNNIDWEIIFKDEFDSIREKIENHNIRISMHPGQYTVLNSLDSSVVDNAIMDLEYHAKVIELLSPNPLSKMIVHVGGVYNDKPEAMKRFIDVCNHRLTDKIKKYLVIENDDKLYTVEDALEISSKTSIPVVFDNLHHDLNPSLPDLNIQEIIRRVVMTWGKQRPKFHYSQQHPTKRAGAHSDTINLDLFIEDYHNIFFHVDGDIMLEVKDKNRSFIKVNQYFNPSLKLLQKEWEKEKYLILSKSENSYDKLLHLFKEDKDVSPINYYRIIDSLTYVESNTKQDLLVLNVMWKSFENICTLNEKKLFQKHYDNKDIRSLKRFLKQLSKKYKISEYQESYYL